MVTEGAGPTAGRMANTRATSRRLHRIGVVELLHHSAIPATPRTPARYLLEGYGPLTDEAISTAEQVLLGKKTLPDCSDDDASHDQVESFRRTAWDAAL